MSLQGTFDTLSVTELFGLLSTASKTGALRLEAGELQASVLVRAGRCCAVDDAAGPVAAAGEAELAARLVDVGFTLARQPEGSFRFSDTEVADAEVSVAFEPAVAEIAAMLDAWKDIEATLPSLDVRVRLAPALRDEEIVLRADEWALLTRLQDRPSIRELVAAGTEPLLDVCRAVKDLVDRGAIEVAAAEAPAAAPASAPVPEPRSAPAPGPSPRSALEGATARLLDPIEPYAPEAIDPEPVAVREPVRVPESATTKREEAPREPAGVPSGSSASASSEEASADRGALLRLFSALKE